jgi:hypothetical protein
MMRGPLLGAATRRSAGGGSEILGYNTIGESSSTFTHDYAVYTTKFTPTQTGTITAVELYSSNSTSTLDIKIGIYNDNGSNTPTTLVGSEAVFTDVGTWSASWKLFSTSFAVTAGTTYWVATLASASVMTYYHGTLANSRWYQIRSYASGMPASASSLTNDSLNHSVRITNTY